MGWVLGAPLDLPAIFGDDRPTVLEIGCANWDSLADMAAADPQRNWLGVGAHGPGVEESETQPHRQPASLAGGDDGRGLPLHFLVG